MKTMIAALAVLFVSTSAFATEYSCYNSSSKNHNGFNAIILGSTITLSGVSAPAPSVQLSTAAASKSGYKAFTGVTGCVSTPPKGFTNCGAISDVTLQVSERLLDGAVQGDILDGSQTYSCEIVRLNE